jgi:hypothetical protein
MIHAPGTGLKHAQAYEGSHDEGANEFYRNLTFMT